jgi:nucleotide-binding universal stress UspA family protein
MIVAMQHNISLSVTRINTMPYKDILVYLDDGASNTERLKAVFDMAKTYGSRVTGVTLSKLKPAHLKTKDKKAFKRMAEQSALDRVEAFNQLASERGLEYGSRVITGDRAASIRKMAQYSRNFDIVVLRQANPHNPNHDLVEELAEQVLLLCGRPVFFMPYIGAHRIPCESAIIAWDGSPSATRAVHDVIPILKDIGNITILVVKSDAKKVAKGELLADDLKMHLQRHAVNADVKRVLAGTFDVPTVILNEIAENDTDLLVMGGYGTPSLKQKIFGGVTKTLLTSMIIPVIMSH